MTTNSYPKIRVEGVGLRCIYCLKSDIYGPTRTYVVRENSKDQVMACRTCEKQRQKAGVSHAVFLFAKTRDIYELSKHLLAQLDHEASLDPSVEVAANLAKAKYSQFGIYDLYGVLEAMRPTKGEPKGIKPGDTY